MLIKRIIVLVIMLIMFLVGAGVGYEMTMRNIKAYAENEGVVLLEVYGQEWVYEE